MIKTRRIFTSLFCYGSMSPERFWLFVSLSPSCFSVSISISDFSVLFWIWVFWGFFPLFVSFQCFTFSFQFYFDLVLGYFHYFLMLPYFYLLFIQMSTHHLKLLRCSHLKSHLKSACSYEEELINLFVWRCAWLQPQIRAKSMFGKRNIGSESTLRDSLSIADRYCFSVTPTAVLDRYFVLFARQKYCPVKQWSSSSPQRHFLILMPVPEAMSIHAFPATVWVTTVILRTGSFSPGSSSLVLWAGPEVKSSGNWLGRILW